MEKEDYEEPVCPFCTPDRRESVPVGRIVGRLDLLFGEKKFDDAVRLLAYWIGEARAIGDERGLLSLLGEAAGLHRKLGHGEEALAAADEALALAEKILPGENVTMGTTLINAATVKKAFGDPGGALTLYERAETVLTKVLPATDSRFGGLYNNMALALADLGRYAEARAAYEKAIAVMEALPDGMDEVAISFCNLADLYEAELGFEGGKEKIEACLARAMAAFRKNEKRDANDAYACEKCAPVLSYYGFVAEYLELTERARRFYEGT